MHVLLVYPWCARADAPLLEVGHGFGMSPRAAGRCIGLARNLLSGSLPTPLACEGHIGGLEDPREIKSRLRGPGRGACIEDGMLRRMRTRERKGLE